MVCGPKQQVDYLAYTNASSKTLIRKGWFLRLTLSGLSALTLGTMGSAVLPLAYTFADTGIVAGFVVLFAVMAANIYTSDLILKQVRATGAPDYEGLGRKVAGGWWQTFTEFSNWLLLFGTIIGGMAQLGEAGSAALQMIWCPSPPKWLIGPMVDGTYVGHWLMVLYIVILVFPWAVLKEMKQLEMAGVVGYPIVLWMTISIVVRCIQQGFPAIGNGELPIVGFTSLTQVAGSVSTWAFAFYIQPLMLPLYSEMPPGNVGYLSTFLGVNGVLGGTAMIPYVLIAFFGAALWGTAAVDTGNVLLNDIYGEQAADGSFACPSPAQGALNFCMTVYLAITIPPLDFALRHTCNSWVSRIKRRFTFMSWIPKRNKGWGGWARNTCISLFNLTACLLLAIFFPAGSGTILTVTGASGVLLVSFVIPIVNHFILLAGKASCQRKQLKVSLDEAQQNALAQSTYRGRDGSALSSQADPNLHRGSMMDEEEYQAQVARQEAAKAARTSDTAMGFSSDTNRPANVKVGFKESSVTAPVPGTPMGAYPDQFGKDTASLKAMNAITSEDPESYRYNAPITNMMYAEAFADPGSYRHKRMGLKFWLIDIIVPLIVLAFGVFCSVCTLATTDWSSFNPAVMDAPPEIESSILVP